MLTKLQHSQLKECTKVDIQVEIDKQFENFLLNVATIRRHYGLSEQKMAELLKIDVKTLKEIECGKLPSELSTEVVFIIYNIFGIHPSVQFERILTAKDLTRPLPPE